ncbi:DUF3159 domain-containing protein [Sphaerisporangium sp. TRM90804]|uniref:DUF3159 domain-containing protein n=1 Tax=Sphaerisporangium sp. TRM90804 TaxID=3031113 RepID=UPI002447DF78|nr:DUF3159 domain-containing protein [Sphaerisporangium sp. TRM90804]MDH2426069.1 DUF3159 domain-containing protein [Sphaerisporangium sp. TRM90804]
MTGPSPAGRPSECATGAPAVSSGESTEPDRHRTPTPWEQTGGLAGLFHSSFPVMVFVVGNSMFGLLGGIGCAVGAAIAFIVLRAVREEPLQPAVSGFIGIAIASFIAYRSGSASGFFLFGIWGSLACFVVLTLSILIRRPLAGVAWSVLNRAPMHWTKDGPSRFGYDVATAVLAAVFAARYVVQNWLYQEDQTGWLAVAKIAMGYPLTALALLAVVWAIRRSDRRLTRPGSF